MPVTSSLGQYPPSTFLYNGPSKQPSGLSAPFHIVSLPAVLGPCWHPGCSPPWSLFVRRVSLFDSSVFVRRVGKSGRPICQALPEMNSRRPTPITLGTSCFSVVCSGAFSVPAPVLIANFSDYRNWYLCLMLSLSFHLAWLNTGFQVCYLATCTQRTRDPALPAITGTLCSKYR